MKQIIILLFALLMANTTNAQDQYLPVVDGCLLEIEWNPEAPDYVKYSFVLTELRWVQRSKYNFSLFDDESVLNYRIDEIDGYADNAVFWSDLALAKQACIASGAGVAGALNGLYLDGTDVKLGTNPLIENTLIEGDGSFSLEIQSVTDGEFQANNQLILGASNQLLMGSNNLAEISIAGGSTLSMDDAVRVITDGSTAGDGIGTRIVDGADANGVPLGDSRIVSSFLNGDILGFTKGVALFATDTLTGQSGRAFVIDGSPLRPYETMFAGMSVENSSGDIAQNSFEFTVFGADTIANAYLQSSTENTNTAGVNVQADAFGDGKASTLIKSQTQGSGDALVVLEAYQDTSLTVGIPQIGLAVRPSLVDFSQEVRMLISTEAIEIGQANLGNAYYLPVTKGNPDDILVTDGAGFVTWQPQSAGGVNLYNTSDTLTSQRVVEGDEFSLRFQNVDGFTVGAIDQIAFNAGTEFVVENSPNIILGENGNTVAMQLNSANVQIGSDDFTGSTIRLKTPLVETGVAQVNDILTLSAVDGTVEFQSVNPKIWTEIVTAPLVPNQYQIIALGDTSIVIEDSLMRLNGANIMDNNNYESVTSSKFGSLITTYNGIDPVSFVWDQDTDPINVWANKNPTQQIQKWRGVKFSSNVEQNFSLPTGLGGEVMYSSHLNSDGNIWGYAFDSGKFWKINPNSNEITLPTGGATFAGQTMVNLNDGLTYQTAISFNSGVQNTQLEKLALVAYPAFDVSVGFTRFNTGMAGAISTKTNVLYSPPYTESQTTQIAFYDLNNNTGGFLAGNISIQGAGDFAYTTCSEGFDGNIYCMPYNNDFLLEIDPLTNNWLQWGSGNSLPVLGANRGGWALINHPNGKMYAPPFVGARAMEIDPVANTITEIGATFASGGANDMKWGSATLHPDGRIYCFPKEDVLNLVLVINPNVYDPTYISGFGFQGVVGNSAYWVSNTPAEGTTAEEAFFNAQAVAEKYQGNIVTIDDLAEQIHVVEIGQQIGENSVLCGLNDIASEGTFTWISGDPVTYTNWGAGEPSGDGDFTIVSSSTGDWNDVPDPRLNGGRYIIELPITYLLGLSSNSTYFSASTALNGSMWGFPQFGNGQLTRLDVDTDWIYPIDVVTSPQFQSR